MSSSCYSRTTIKGANKKIKHVYKNKKTNTLVKDEKTIDILNKVIVPASYSSVEICPDAKVRGIGYDGNNQKQYFYSPSHIEKRTKEKNCNLIHLAEKLPIILKDIDKLLLKCNLNRKNGDKDKHRGGDVGDEENNRSNNNSNSNSNRNNSINLDTLIALSLKIMFQCYFRVGSDKNREIYKSYGLTTITKKHLKLSSNQANISFIGKKQQLNQCTLTDKICLKLLKKITFKKDGDEPLFSYNDFSVTPQHLNNFLASYHPEITTKTIRTYMVNILYIQKLLGLKKAVIPETVFARKRLSNEFVKEIATKLYHTPAINKKNYLIKELPLLLIETPDKFKKYINETHSAEGFFKKFIKREC